MIFFKDVMPREESVPPRDFEIMQNTLWARHPEVLFRLERQVRGAIETVYLVIRELELPGQDDGGRFVAHLIDRLDERGAFLFAWAAPMSATDPDVDERVAFYRGLGMVAFDGHVTETVDVPRPVMAGRARPGMDPVDVDVFGIPAEAFERPKRPVLMGHAPPGMDPADVDAAFGFPAGTWTAACAARGPTDTPAP